MLKKQVHMQDFVLDVFHLPLQQSDIDLNQITLSLVDQ